jgi:hypothetical protein
MSARSRWLWLGGLATNRYNLNVVEFKFQSKMSFDDGWPAFAEKSFGSRSSGGGGLSNVGSRKASGGLFATKSFGKPSQEPDAVSLVSTLSVLDQERSITQLRARVNRLRTERDAARRESATALEDKQEVGVGLPFIFTFFF